jgi:methionine transaminase
LQITSTNINIDKKLPDWGTSIFAIMSKMAVEHNALNLSQGFPDFSCSDELLSLVNDFQKKGFNQYAPMPGVPVLRNVISDTIKKVYGRNYNPETEITVTSGATQAIYTAVSCVIKKGDEAIVFDPAYDCYAPSIEANGAIPVRIPLKKDFTYDWDEIRKRVNEKTKLMIFNSPHNPSGSLIQKADIDQLIGIVKGTDILLISDEVYEFIVFDNEKHHSFTLYDELYERSFVISSFGKTFHTTGWKTGYCSAPEYLMKEFRKLHQFVVFSSNTPIQHAYAEYLKDEKNYSSLSAFYQNKKDLFAEAMQNSRFKVLPCKGTYFQLLNYSDISDKNDMEFTEYLTKEIGIATIPLSPFYKNGSNEKVIRLCFAKKDEVMLEAAKILSAL